MEGKGKAMEGEAITGGECTSTLSPSLSPHTLSHTTGHGQQARRLSLHASRRALLPPPPAAS